MTAIPFIQPSFAAGELSPFLYGRVDLAKFKVGARTLQNFFVHAHGGASNRPGTRFIGEVDDSTQRHRLIPFQFRTLPAGQTYVLVFGHHTMQVAMNTGTTLGFVESVPGQRFTLVTPYAAADLALLKFVQSADTMTLTHPNYAARKLTRSGHANWTLAQITFRPSTPVPTGLFAISGGSAAIVQVTAIADATGEESLPTMGIGSSNATAGSWGWDITPGCSTWNVYKLKGSVYGFVAQVQTNGWTDANIDPDIANTAPGSRNPFGAGTLTGITVTAGGAHYNAPTATVMDGGSAVTGVVLGTSGGVITSASLADTTKTVSPNAYVQVADGGGGGASLTPVWGPIDPDTGLLTLTGISVDAGGSGYSANTRVTAYLLGVQQPQVTLAPVISGGVITAVNITAGGLVFGGERIYVTLGITDTTGSGASFALVITGAGDGGNQNPACSTYYLQRQAFANTLSQPQSLWFSTVGAFGNMNVSTPTKDSDAITRTLTGRQVNEIRHLVPVGTSMLVMTSGAEWRCWPGPSSNALTPGACFTLPQTAHGSSHVPPIQAGNDVLFIQEKGSRVRALRFDAIQDQYQSFDMSVLSSHLLYDTSGTHQIVEWAFAAEPHQIVWGVRSDGVLLGFTYMREHDVYAWHRHVTDGTVESVATVTEPDGDGGYEDALWLVVNRTVNGQTRRYLEHMVSRTFATIADAWFVDCGLAYDGTNRDATHTLRLSGASWAAGASVTLSAAGFAPFNDPASLGRKYRLVAGDDSVTVEITAVATGSHVTATARLESAVPASLQGTATGDWILLAATVDGLDHIEGKTVALLGDGNVMPSQVVSGGRVALDGAYVKVIAGLPYTADLETLNLELPTQASPTSQGQLKKIGQVVVRVKEARGLCVGLNQGALQEVKQRAQETLGTALQPFTGDWQISVPSEWNREGRIFVRQSYPLPATILDLIPEVSLGN